MCSILPTGYTTYPNNMYGAEYMNDTSTTIAENARTEMTKFFGSKIGKSAPKDNVYRSHGEACECDRCKARWKLVNESEK